MLSPIVHLIHVFLTLGYLSLTHQSLETDFCCSPSNGPDSLYNHDVIIFLPVSWSCLLASGTVGTTFLVGVGQSGQDAAFRPFHLWIQASTQCLPLPFPVQPSPKSQGAYWSLWQTQVGRVALETARVPSPYCSDWGRMALASWEKGRRRKRSPSETGQLVPLEPPADSLNHLHLFRGASYLEGREGGRPWHKRGCGKMPSSQG